MKTPDEIKKGLEYCADGIDCSNECPYHIDCIFGDDNHALEHDALAYIQQLEAQVPKWISVEERVPDTQQQILFIAANGLMVAGKFSHIGKTGVIWFRSGRGKSSVTYHATHWMPMPEPPKEDVHGQETQAD